MHLLATDLELARNSYYAATAVRGAGYPALSESTTCDVAVVGGGLAGISAALELAERGQSVVLLEAREMGWGASGRNGGQAIHGLACEQSLIEEQLGLDEARRVWAMSIEALDLIRQRISRFGLACDWRDGYLSLATSEGKGEDLSAWADRLEAVYGYPLTRIAPAQMPQWIASRRYHSGIHDPHSGHLHPLKYTLGLARAAAAAGVRMHEHTPVQALIQGTTPGHQPVLRTAAGDVRARQVLLAGNVYLHGIAPAIEPRIMPVGTYIACSEALAPALADSLIPSRSAACDTNFVLDYFRTTNDHRMLYGGRVSYSTTTPANLARSMHQRMVQTFPQLASAEVEYAWGGFVDISMNRAPDFGRLPAVAAGAPQDVYYLQGFSGHGLALSGLAGRVVAEAMAGDASRFDIFARLRHRAFPGGALLRTPALVLGMAWYRLRDMLG
jgi:gamma-glutamylputrescine oxidase